MPGLPALPVSFPLPLGLLTYSPYALISAHDPGATLRRQRSVNTRFVREAIGSRQGMASKPPAAETETPEATTAPNFEAARRLLESFLIAAVTSTGLYLVGSVYTDSYYGRMSIDATALDLSPPFIALQATNVIQQLLAYPIFLLVLWVPYRLIVARFPALQSWASRTTERFGGLGLLVVNLVVVAPLVVQAIRVGGTQALIENSSLLGEIAGLMQTTGVAMLLYVIWLSLGPRLLFFDQIRERRLLPVTLLIVLYLLISLLSTSRSATEDAELLMTGKSASSVAITFTLANGVTPLPAADLLLVTIRNGHYFVVERQPDPPSLRPVAYAIPIRAADEVRLQRVNDASGLSGIGIIIGEETPSP